MDADQIAELLGAVCGVILSAFVANKLFKSKHKTILVVSVSLGWLALIGVRSLGRAGERKRAVYDSAFRKACLSKCSADAAVCGKYCDCESKAFSKHPDKNKLTGASTQQGFTPGQRKLLVDIVMSCMEPELYDTNFANSCSRNCRGDCSAQCRCLLERLREGMDARAGTAWLIANLELEPATPEGKARMQQAIATCSSKPPGR